MPSGRTGFGDVEPTLKKLSLKESEQMKLTLFSDTHTLHEKVQFSGGDVVIFCGDLSRRGDLSEVKEFSSLPFNIVHL